MFDRLFGGLPRSVIEFFIEEWIVNMPGAERNRYIMRRRYLDGLTYEQIAEEVSMSDWQVKQIVAKCDRKIRNAR
jgi:RNA polymerase sigma factor (sigma-70 family)